MSNSKVASILAAVLVVAVAALGCEVIGYDTPGRGSGSWRTVQETDPATGDSLASVSTRTSPNSFFGKVLSVFGRPELTVSCVRGSGEKVVSIDWREAVGPSGDKVGVLTRFDGGDTQDLEMEVDSSGRRTARRGVDTYVSNLRNSGVLAVRIVNPGGNEVTLVFNVGGFDAAHTGMVSACA